jgi:DNA-directed RNA polymerase subunit M/transcription elongation factor TFIIS
MYYIHIDDKNANKLIYFCHNCGNEDQYLANTNISVSKTVVKKQKQAQGFDNIVNKFTKLDPTLPRVTNILCTNINCKTNTNTNGENKREVIYMRYDDVNMKYIYLCCECDAVWKPN